LSDYRIVGQAVKERAANKTARAGTYSVNITYAGIADEKFIDIDNGSIKLIALVGDINIDCKVDYKDLGMLGSNYGKTY